MAQLPYTCKARKNVSCSKPLNLHHFKDEKKFGLSPNIIAFTISIIGRIITGKQIFSLSLGEYFKLNAANTYRLLYLISLVV